MDLETLKKELLSMIERAIDVPKKQLSAKVKIRKEDMPKFQSYAYLYTSLQNKEVKEDYLTIVYQELVSLIKSKKETLKNDKDEKEVKVNITNEINALQKQNKLDKQEILEAFTNLNNQYQETIKNIEVTDDFDNLMTLLSGSIAKLEDNRKALHTHINVIENEANEAFLEVMGKLKNSTDKKRLTAIIDDIDYNQELVLVDNLVYVLDKDQVEVHDLLCNLEIVIDKKRDEARRIASQAQVLLKDYNTLQEKNETENAKLYQDWSNTFEEIKSIKAKLIETQDFGEMAKLSSELQTLIVTNKEQEDKLKKHQKEANTSFQEFLDKYMKLIANLDTQKEIEDLKNNLKTKEEDLSAYMYLVDNAFYIREDVDINIGSIYDNLDIKKHLEELSSLTSYDIKDKDKDYDIKDKEVLEETKQETEVKSTNRYNQKFINFITNLLKNIADKRLKNKKKSVLADNNIRVLPKDLERYNALLKVLEIAQKPNYQETNNLDLLEDDLLDTAILRSDEEAFEEYFSMGCLEYAKNLVAKRSLKYKLDELGNKIIKNDAPSDVTNKYEDNSWLVLKTDIVQANKIISLLEVIDKALNYILTNADFDNLVMVDNIYLLQEDIPKYEEIKGEIQKIEDEVLNEDYQEPVILENLAEDEDIEEVKKPTISSNNVMTNLKPSYSQTDLINTMINSQAQEHGTLNQELTDDDIDFLDAKDETIDDADIYIDTSSEDNTLDNLELDDDIPQPLGTIPDLAEDLSSNIKLPKIANVLAPTEEEISEIEKVDVRDLINLADQYIFTDTNIDGQELRNVIFLKMKELAPTINYGNANLITQQYSLLYDLRKKIDQKLKNTNENARVLKQ